MLKKLSLFVCLSVFCFSNCQARPIIDPLSHPFYIGGLGGYGSTTWDGLVPAAGNQNAAINISAPIEVDEGGGAWGGLLGYELTPHFAVEVSYMRFRGADVAFDEDSLFCFDHDGLTHFRTYTDTLSFMGKLMIDLFDNGLRAFSSLGIARLHREDMILSHHRLEPTFGVGINYRFSEHIMGEINGNYTAGYGESQLNPTYTYFPFIYSATFRLAYRF